MNPLEARQFNEEQRYEAFNRAAHQEKMAHLRNEISPPLARAAIADTLQTLLPTFVFPGLEGRTYDTTEFDRAPRSHERSLGRTSLRDLVPDPSSDLPLDHPDQVFFGPEHHSNDIDAVAA